MADIASLGLKIDSSDATSATSALDKLTTAGGSAAASADKLAASGAKSETVLRAIEAAAKRAGISFDEMSKRVDDANTSVGQGAAASDKATKATTSHAAALGKTTTAAKDGGKELGKLAEISSVLESRMLSLGNSTGLIGEVLTVIGPGGLAAAAGIGALVVVVDQLVGSANRMGEFAQQLQNLSVVSGVSTTALQALQTEAVGFGLSATQTGTFLERFTQQLDGVRKGSGSLYTELLKIDPALLQQLSVAKSTTEALNLLAQAYAKAGSSQNALASAAGAGRGTAGSVGLLLGDIASKGNVEALTSSVNQLDLVTQKQVETWSKLKREIDDAASNAKNNVASIYTGAVLEAEKTFYDKFLDFSREMKQFSISSDYKTFMDSLTKDAGPGKTTIFGYLSSLPGKAMTAVGDRIKSVNANRLPDAPNFDQSFGANFNPAHAAEGPPAPSPDASKAVQASMAAAQVSFLGSAATATERYDAAEKKLNADVAQNSMLTGLQGRALAALGMDKAISEQSSYVSALGVLATTQDKVTLASLNFQKAQLTNSRLTNDQRESVKLIVAANDEWSRASQQAQIGVFDLGAATKATGDLLKSWIAQGLLDPKNPEQYAAAMQVAANKVTALSDAAKIAGSSLPQMTQLGLDAGNMLKQIDTFGVSSMNGLSSGLVDIGTHSVSASDGFRAFGLTVVKSLAQMGAQMLIIKPLMTGLGSIFGGLFGGTGTVANGGIVLGGAAGPGVFAAADGGTFGPGWGVVGERGPELINVHSAGVTVIPNHISRPYLPGFADGGTLSSGGNVSRLPGMGQDNTPSVNITNYNDFRGADPGSEARMKQYVDQSSKQAVQSAVQQVSTIKGASPGYLRSAR